MRTRNRVFLALVVCLSSCALENENVKPIQVKEDSFEKYPFVDPRRLSKEERLEIYNTNIVAYNALASEVACSRSKRIGKAKDLYVRVFIEKLGYNKVADDALILFSHPIPGEMPGLLLEKYEGIAPGYMHTIRPIARGIEVRTSTKRPCSYVRPDFIKFEKLASSILAHDYPVAMCGGLSCNEISLTNLRRYN